MVFANGVYFTSELEKVTVELSRKVELEYTVKKKDKDVKKIKKTKYVDYTLNYRQPQWCEEIKCYALPFADDIGTVNSEKNFILEHTNPETHEKVECLQFGKNTTSVYVG